MIKMTEEQKALFDKLTTLQQEVSLNSISGMSDIDSYRNSSGKAESESARRAGASEILANPNVKAFIDSMKAVAVSNAVMSRTEMLERLSNIARVPLSDLVEFSSVVVSTEDGEHVQSQWSFKDSAEQSEEAMSTISELTAGREGLKIKQHSPLQAMKMISDMQGYNAPIKTEQSGEVVSISMSKKEYAETRKKMLEQDDC